MTGIAVDQEAVLVGTAKGPGLWLAPIGTTLPTDAVTELDAAFYTVGFISDAGVTVASDLSSTDLFAWQASTPIRTIIESRTYTFDFEMVETSAETLALYFDSTATGDLDTGLAVPIPDTPQGQRYAAVIEGQDGEVVTRLVFGSVTLSDASDLEMTRSTLQAWPVTLKVGAHPGNAVYARRGTEVDPGL